jgi:hypothetical protein
MRKITILFLILFFSFSFSVSSQKIFEISETEKLSLDLSVKDPDADKLVYTFTKPLDKKGEWQTKYGDAGEYTATVTVSDGKTEVSEEIIITVHRKDEKPVINKFSPQEIQLDIDEGKAIKFNVEASDLNKDELRYTWSINEEFVSNEKSVTFETGYKDSGEYSVMVVVGDGLFTTSKEWVVNVIDVELDALIGGIEDIIVTETETARLKLPNFKKYGLSYEIADPLGSDNAWKTGYDDAGEYDVKINVKGKDFKSERDLKIIVNNKDRPPILSGLRDISLMENENIVLEFSAEDLDGDVIVFSVENIPQGGILEGNAFKWKPGFDFVRKENVFDHVLDSFRLLSKTAEVIFIAQSNGLKDEKKVRIRVKDNNRPFVLEDIADIVVNEGEEIIINPKYNDPDLDKVSFSYSGFMNSNSKKTGFNDAGDYSVKVTASDGYHTQTTFVNLRVNDVNRKPVIKNIRNMKIKEGEELKIELSGTDSDNDVISYSASDLPKGSKLKGNLFIWKPGFEVVDGTEKEMEMEFIVSDGRDESRSKMKITVLDTNQAPEITDFSDNLIAVRNKPIQFYVNATDLDSNELTYSWDFGVFSKFTDGNEHQRVFTSAGTKEVQVTVSDGVESVSKVWEIDVI